MTDAKKARPVGFNHVALEVGDLDEALAFYGRFLDFELRSRSQTMAFVDLGDQFLALATGRRQAPDDERHLGLVVDDKAAVRRALDDMGVDYVEGGYPLSNDKDVELFARLMMLHGSRKQWAMCEGNRGNDITGVTFFRRSLLD